MRMMSTYLLLSFCLFFSFTGLKISAQQMYIQRFTAAASGTDVLLNWEIKSGISGITEFRIQRKVNQEPVFTQISTSNYSQGKNAYEFWDRTIFKETPKQIQYRLLIIKDGQTSYYDTFVTLNPTSAQRTWGSIKSMFK